VGKVTIYQCDYCNQNYNSPSQVMSIDGDILDGNDTVIIEESKGKLICIKCLIDKLQSIKDFIVDETVEEEIGLPPNWKLLKKISTKKEEEDFINLIGHVSRDSFDKVYNKSLIGHYYPLELDDGENIDVDDFGKKRIVDVIYKVFASIPQVKKMSVLANSENFAIADETLFDE